MYLGFSVKKYVQRFKFRFWTPVNIFKLPNKSEVKTNESGWNLFFSKLSSRNLLASSDSNGNIKIYNLTDNYTIYSSFLAGSGEVHDLVFISDEILAIANSDGTIGIWNLKTKNLITSLIQANGIVYKLLLISPNLLASSSVDFSISLWDLTNYAKNGTLVGHNKTIYSSLTLDLYDSNILYSGSEDMTIKAWDISSNTMISSLNIGLEIKALAVCLSSTCEFLIFCSKLLRIYFKNLRDYGYNTLKKT